MSVMYIRNEQTGEFEPVPSLVGPQGPPGSNGDGTGTVTSVNKVAPDATGNVTLTAADVGALPSDGTAANAIQLNGKDASEYVLHSDALTLEEIKASTDLTGKVPDAASIKTMSVLIGTGKFSSLYDLKQTGITTPETWGGVIRVAGQNWGTTFVSDSYFFAITASGIPYVGTQINSATDITWTKITTG